MRKSGPRATTHSKATVIRLSHLLATSTKHPAPPEAPLPVIRTADRSDAGPLSRLAEATFRSTFGAVNSPQDMALHCQVSYSEAIQAGEIANPDMLTLLCDGDEGLVGFAQLRWDGAPHCVAAQSPGEIQRLYVADAWHGKGIAQGLMHACIEALQARNSDVAWLGVWERNPRAIAFYRKCGFVGVGDHVFPLGSDPQRDIVMARSIAGPSSNIAPQRGTSGERP